MKIFLKMGLKLEATREGILSTVGTEFDSDMERLMTEEEVAEVKEYAEKISNIIHEVIDREIEEQEEEMEKSPKGQILKVLEESLDRALKEISENLSEEDKKEMNRLTKEQQDDLARFEKRLDKAKSEKEMFSILMEEIAKEFKNM